MPSLLGTGPGVHLKSLKTVNQSLKHKVNRCVLSLHLNECKLSASRTAAGRLFHTAGPATEKALSPNFVLVRGTQLNSSLHYLVRNKFSKITIITVNQYELGVCVSR